MYCPSCRTEYRSGFKMCSDCNVPLVPELPEEHSSATSGGPIGAVLVWSGNDERHRAEACSALERAGIRPHAVSREDHLIAPSEHPRFEVYVAAEVADKAKQTLSEAVVSNEEWEQLEASGALALPDEDVPAAERTFRNRKDWHPEDATVEIWSGKDADLAEMIVTSLRENQIDCRQGPFHEDSEDVPEPSDTQRLFVLPEDEAHAKEIIREILDATPL